MKKVIACLLAVVLMFGAMATVSAEISPTASVADKYLIVDATPVTADKGTATPPVSNPDMIEVGSGETSTLIATPKDGYRFVYWELKGGPYDIVSGNFDSSTLIIKPTGDENIHAYAYFEKQGNVTVIAEAKEGGSAEVQPDTDNDKNYEVFDFGDTAVVKATAQSGYRFVKWELSYGTYTPVLGDLTTQTIILKPKTDCKFVAYFEKLRDGEKVLNAHVDYDKGGYAASSTDVVYVGDRVIFSATVDPNYIFKGWIIEGEYEIVSGDLNSLIVIIKPITDVFGYAHFVPVPSQKPSPSPVSPTTGDSAPLYLAGLAALLVVSFAATVIIKKKRAD